MQEREYRRAELKREVRAAIRQTRPRPVLVTLLFLLILGVSTAVINWVGTLLGTGQLTGAAARIAQLEDPERMLDALLFWVSNNGGAIALLLLVSAVLSIISALWSGLLDTGYKGYCLSVARRENPPLERVFCAFPRFGQVILARILVAVFTFLWSLAFTVGLVIVCLIGALLVATAILLPVGVLVLVAGVIAYAVALVWVELRYAMTDYLVIDRRLSGLDAITESKKMMKGNKGRLFVLRLSFIGWYLICFAIVLVGVVIIAACAAVGAAPVAMVLAVILVVVVMLVAILLLNLWLMPYVGGSEAAFYDFCRGGQQPSWSQGQAWNSRPGGASDPYGGGYPPVSGGQSSTNSDQGTYTYHPDGPQFDGPAAPPAPPVFPTPSAPAEPEAPTEPAPPAAAEAPAEPASPVEPAGEAASTEEPFQEESGAREDDDQGTKPPSGPSYPEY